MRNLNLYQLEFPYM